MKLTINFEKEEVTICKECNLITEYKDYWIDWWYFCEACWKDNFTGDLKIINADKIIHEYILIKE
jgi:hypothetical protein